jgi:aryl-alcohol dehydrogenase-like predicted oxidoreductase
MINNKLVLGTAQFGLDYGINNPRGVIPKTEALAILLSACEKGIDTIDTAESYGLSEQLIGEFIRQYKKDLKIITKLSLSQTHKSVAEHLSRSLDNLGVVSLEGYLLHNFEDYRKNPGIWGELCVLKEDGLTRKIGFSLYYPQEIEYLLKQGIVPDIVQLPYNVFDRRFESYFDSLNNAGIEIHARSIFLQGLVFKDPGKLHGNFTKIKGKLELLNKIAKESGVPVFAICLNFVVRNQYIHKCIVGVDTISNFKGLLSYTDYTSLMDSIDSKLAFVVENDEKVVLPVNWK